MVSDGDRGGLVLGCVGWVGQVGCDLCGSGFWIGGSGGLISIGVILVGNGVVSGCNAVDLVVQRLGQ